MPTIRLNQHKSTNTTAPVDAGAWRTSPIPVKRVLCALFASANRIWCVFNRFFPAGSAIYAKIISTLRIRNIALVTYVIKETLFGSEMADKQNAEAIPINFASLCVCVCESVLSVYASNDYKL